MPCLEFLRGTNADRVVKGLLRREQNAERNDTEHTAYDNALGGPCIYVRIRVIMNERRLI